MLSLWEPIGAKGQWVRVGVINHALHSSQHEPTELEGLDFRKRNIRAFNWCPPLHTPTPTDGSDEPAEPESRWGIHMLAVATDTNEVALIQVRRISGSQALPEPYHLEKVAFHTLEENQEQFPSTCSGSLLNAALQSKARVTSISCGPWLPVANEHSISSATAMIAVVFGTQLRFLKTTIALSESDPESKVIPRYETTAELKDHVQLAASFPKWASQAMAGPVEWLHTVC